MLRLAYHQAASAAALSSRNTTNHFFCLASRSTARARLFFSMVLSIVPERPEQTSAAAACGLASDAKPQAASMGDGCLPPVGLDQDQHAHQHGENQAVPE